MTKLHPTPKPRWREAESTHGKPFAVALTPAGLLIRRKGSRKPLLLPYATAFVKAAFLEANRLRSEKSKNRKVLVKRGH